MTVLGYYILIGRQPVEITDAGQWARTLMESERRVGATRLPNAAPWYEIDAKRGLNQLIRKVTPEQAADAAREVLISTVFLGLNHRFADDGPPLLFETMVFNGPLHGAMDRFSTWDDAEAGHSSMVARCRVALDLTAEVGIELLEETRTG